MNLSKTPAQRGPVLSLTPYWLLSEVSAFGLRLTAVRRIPARRRRRPGSLGRLEAVTHLAEFFARKRAFQGPDFAEQPQQ